ncbi:MAG TPA: transcriptional regulator [Bacillota bacterium]|nr:transcriptional regulator [Bacillota bacterium]
MNNDILTSLNELFQTKARLGIMTTLATMEECDFSTLKSHLELTDGNLSAHLRVLEEAGYLAVEKKFVNRKPKTLYRLTEPGREAFLTYLRQLAAIIRMVDQERDPTLDS